MTETPERPEPSAAAGTRQAAGDARQDRHNQLTVALLRPCVLVHLLGGTAYGYELHHRLTSMGVECDLGTVYRALNTMEDEGLLRSTWERSEAGRSRRQYELSQAGADVVDSFVPAVERLVGVGRSFLDMRRLLGGAEGRGTCRLEEPEPPVVAPRATPPARVIPEPASQPAGCVERTLSGRLARSAPRSRPESDAVHNTPALSAHREYSPD